jgi:hypothetical protein
LTSFWWRKFAKTFFQACKTSPSWDFLPKVFLTFLYENKSFLKFFLSKCLELKALSTLKVSLKSEKLLYGVVEIRWKYLGFFKKYLGLFS